MGTFLDEEKHRYIAYKASSQHLPDAARLPGIYDEKPRPFCLPEEFAGFSLFEGIRDEVQAYFQDAEIKWHDGRNRQPSNHLCDSQVCCVNFLYSFSSFPDALASLLRPVFPQIRRMLPLEQDGHFVSHEWIGAKNYLGEKVPHHGNRTRGAHFTSADAAVLFETTGGSKHIALIEWKYTETYATVNLKTAKSGTDRTGIYRHLYDHPDFPLDKARLGNFDALFFEPFYQLMRQQLLASAMEKSSELGADTVSLLHIAPARNRQLERVTSPQLTDLSDTVTGVWQRLVTKADRFHSVSIEALFGGFEIDGHPEMRPWWEYTSSRYPWFRPTPADA